MLLDFEMVKATGITRASGSPFGSPIRALSPFAALIVAEPATRVLSLAAYTKKAPPEGEALSVYGGGGGN